MVGLFGRVDRGERRFVGEGLRSDEGDECDEGCQMSVCAEIVE